MVVLIKMSAPGWDFEGTPQEVKENLISMAYYEAVMALAEEGTKTLTETWH